ncbi:MAG TPA: DNA polymerase III subunit delta [Actinomycetota bacterium]|nr:DNA polymerase III subunit delta [Actinomycetota bacterium]
MSAKPVTLLWGDDRYLLREAGRALFDAAEPTVASGAEWRPGLTADLATPSLLGEPRGLLVLDADDLPGEAVDEIAAYAASPSPDACLVLCWSVGPRAKGPPKAIVSRLGNIEVTRVAVDRKDLPRWVLDRARRRGVPATPQGATALVQTVGEDAAGLAQAVEQVATAHPKDGLTPQTVAAQFRGFGDRRTWELCDAAFTGDGPGALRALTGMLEAGEEPIMILGGVAARVRDLLRVAALDPRTPLGDAARAAGLRFDWQARRYRDQARRYGVARLRVIHQELVEADRSLKQGGAGDVVLVRLVAAIASAGGERVAARSG